MSSKLAKIVGYGWNVEGVDLPPTVMTTTLTGPPSGPPDGDVFGPATMALLCGGGSYWAPSQFGEVPGDAVRAGVDKTGEPLFVGRAFHEGDVVPAKIVQSHGGAYVPWGGGEHKKDYYEVLCADSGRVCWTADSKGHVPAGAVAIGNTERGEALYVGRVLHDGTLTPGKVHGSHGCCYIPYGGKELSFPEYEVLVIV